ncbi:hypothetical protein [Catenulispora pinistramenti]|uniref:hypothetical protein n=1 Tax=Catenulispora pinistramenti TaxID=2705254 RepID=UPI001BAC4B35|nr:hypothetical protein [Catenulispora pinistramenti]
MPPARAGSPLRSPVVAGVVGLVVGAVVVGVPWLLTSSSSSPFGADKSALTAPASIGAFTPMVKNSKTPAATLKTMEESATVGAKNLSAAYGGAAAVSQEYSDAGLENYVVLEAVRAQSPIPYVPYEDAHALGMDKPEQEIDTFGQVHCLIANIPVAVGQAAQPNGTSAVTCERTSAHLTVRLRFGGDGDVMHSPQQAAALVDTAWGELS